MRVAALSKSLTAGRELKYCKLGENKVDEYFSALQIHRYRNTLPFGKGISAWKDQIDQ